jgi:acetolactate synthase small subunit
MKQRLRILVLDRPTVLARVAGQVARRGVNIDHFTARNVKGGKTLITIGIDNDEQMADRLAKGLARLIDVLEVDWGEDEDLEPPPAALSDCRSEWSGRWRNAGDQGDSA